MSSAELQSRIQQGFQEEIEETKLLDCMRCGFCLPACPTYIHSNYDEAQSPRGRIALMKAVRDGDLPFDDSVEESLDLCLGCRACEPACPAGVEYGSLLESARNVIQKEKKQSVKEKVVRHAAFDHLFKDQQKMNRTAGMVKFYQRSGLQTLTRKMGILSFFPSVMKDMEKVLPRIEKNEVEKGVVYEGKRQNKKVAFFTGCLMEPMFSKTNEATVNLLQELGCDVWVPEHQVCCGALQGHSGELDKARENAKQNIESFLEMDVDYIVNNAGGCGAFLSEYDHLLKDEPELLEKAKAFSDKIIDITSLIYELGLTEKGLSYIGDKEITVTYQDSCHLRNVNLVKDEPREILKSIENVHFVDLKSADQCCGSAGIYNLVQPEMSIRILDNKMEDVESTHASIIITTNPGCLLQMKMGIERAGLSDQMEALHLVDFIQKYILEN
ncbi:(Fe-S)-binding protein [Tenuibacillus multivorans]|uniref:Glycolate oxidase iron-sulfur subunit n=1 Tax=Tenuibacillus multivorans TaxID=237069 RepID=A0A1H0BZ62_9BACI|nr:(Fe-S)-binding protein [Tenuibacillus multivorans]GEL78577.1 putative glycolate oxidase iron-sulfur subunit [Tenuibacillus multivorans]SDN50855.1 glycolate oxidase iron-sulfur subunit [Tenuibacillus multivorans]